MGDSKQLCSMVKYQILHNLHVTVRGTQVENEKKNKIKNNYWEFRVETFQIDTKLAFLYCG